MKNPPEIAMIINDEASLVNFPKSFVASANRDANIIEGTSKNSFSVA